MTTQTDLLEQKLSRSELQAIKNRRAGILIFQLSWIMVFICLVIVHFQLRSSYSTWPPEGVEPLNPIPGILATIALISSGFLARSALKSVQQDQVQPFLNQWRIAIALGAAFVAVMIFEFIRVPMGTQYGTLFRVMAAFHSVHAVAIGLMMVNIYRSGQKGVYQAANFWPVEAAAKLWYFVVVAWILFYLPLYWI